MACTRRSFLAASAAASLGAVLSACGRPAPAPAPAAPDGGDAAPSVDVHAYDALAFDGSAWSHDEEHDVYYRLCVPYCLTPASSTVQRLSIFVPGAYFDAEAKGDTFSCAVAEGAKVGSFDSSNAPVVMPVDSASWRGQTPASTYSYEGLKPYMDAGCVYVLAGCRGRATGFESRGQVSGDGTVPGGLPWNVCDLKSAIRFLRYNAGLLPGGASGVFCLGVGAGASLVACLGASGDAPGFDPFLDAEGAARWDGGGATLSDAPSGCAIWNPVGPLASADGAYEWLYGRHVADGTRSPDRWTSALSRDLSGSFGRWVSGLGLTDSENAPLALDDTLDGEASDGSYLQAVLAELEGSAKRFFDATAFPATVVRGAAEQASFPGVQPSSTETAEELAEGAQQNAEAVASAGLDVDLGAASTVEGVQAQPKSLPFETAKAYVASLNGDGDPWLSYSPSRGTVRVGSLGAYVRALAAPALACTAFDGVGCDTAENQLLGVPDTQTLHYSEMVYDLLNHRQWEYRSLAGWDPRYVGAWGQNLTVRDAQGLTPPERCSLCDALAYLAPGGEAFSAGTVAPAWRVNVGLAQSEAPFTAAMDLAWALRSYDGVSTADLTAVWEGGFGLCEESGDPVANALAWVAAHNG